MKAKQRSQYSRGINTGNNQGSSSRRSSSSIRKNEDISVGDSVQEQPSPDPKINPDMPPNPARREYDDTGHEHEYNDPTANRKRK